MLKDIDKQTLLIFLAIFIILVILIILTILQLSENNKNVNLSQETIEKLSNTSVREIPDHALYQSSGILQSFNPVHNNLDALRNYDYGKIIDPLVEPTRRIARHELPPYYFRRLIDLPTRGYPDNFTQFGILIEEGKKEKDSDNKILRLFGRQEFPGSNRYEYYTAINSGADQIKIPINVRQQELYDGDIVFIDELNKKYRVKLHKYDAPKYYPDLI